LIDQVHSSRPVQVLLIGSVRVMNQAHSLKHA